MILDIKITILTNTSKNNNKNNRLRDGYGGVWVIL